MNNIIYIIKNLGIANWIQVCIFVALVWYSLETRSLRKWQKKQVQLSLLQLDMKRVEGLARGSGLERFNPIPYAERFSIIVRKIYELGEFNLNVLYGDKEPLTRFGKIIYNLKQKIKKIKK